MMYFVGALFGVYIDQITAFWVNWTIAYTRSHGSERWIVFLPGVLQLVLNATIIRSVSSLTRGQAGLFSLGLLSSQTLVIRRTYSHFSPNYRFEE